MNTWSCPDWEKDCRTNYRSVFWEVLSERVRTGVGWGQNGKECLEGGNICIFMSVSCCLGFPGSSDGKVSACNVGDLGSIPGSGTSPGEGNGNPFQYSCLENSMDGGARWAPVHGVTKSRTRRSDFTFLLVGTVRVVLSTALKAVCRCKRAESSSSTFRVRSGGPHGIESPRPR